MRRLFALNRDQRRMQLSGLLWGFGISLFLYIQPLYIASLGASPAQIGLVLGLSGGLVTFLYIPIGLWADRRGRKPVILAGWGLGAVATFAIALAPDWRWLIPAMSVYMLSNFAMPAFHGYIAASDRGGNLSRTMAVIAAGSSVGSIVSPALGGWIGEQFGLRAVYLCAAVAFTLSTLALWGLTDQPAERHVVTGSPVQLLSNRSFIWQVLFILLLFFAIDLGQVMMPKFLEDVRGLSVGQIGWLGTAGSLGVVLFSLVLGHLPVERREALLLGQLLALTAGVLVLRTPVPAFILLAYFVHGNNRVVRPLVIGRLARNLDATTMSFGYGFYETAMRLGLAMSPLVAGLLYARQPTWPLYAGIAGLSLTMLLTFTLSAAGRAPAPAVVLAASAERAALPGVEAATGSGKAG